MKHSPEPWKTMEGKRCWHVGDVAGTFQTGCILDNSEANARRIVACVNACAGIPTEALEAGVVGELRAACEVLLIEADDCAGDGDAVEAQTIPWEVRERVRGTGEGGGAVSKTPSPLRWSTARLAPGAHEYRLWKGGVIVARVRRIDGIWSWWPEGDGKPVHRLLRVLHPCGSGSTGRTMAQQAARAWAQEGTR